MAQGAEVLLTTALGGAKQGAGKTPGRGAPNQSLQETPGCAFLLIVAQVPGAPEPWPGKD